MNNMVRCHAVCSCFTFWSGPLWSRQFCLFSSGMYRVWRLSCYSAWCFFGMFILVTNSSFSRWRFSALFTCSTYTSLEWSESIVTLEWFLCSKDATKWEWSEGFPCIDVIGQDCWIPLYNWMFGGTEDALRRGWFCTGQPREQRGALHGPTCNMRFRHMLIAGLMHECK